MLTLLLTTLVTYSPPARAQDQTDLNKPAVLHLALLRSWREHNNFELAQARLRDANPDRRIVTMVRERVYAHDGGFLRDESVEALNADLRAKLTDVRQPIDLVYVQMNNLAWMSEAWSMLDGGEDLEGAAARNPILALRGKLTPDARLVCVGHGFMDLDVAQSERQARKLLEYLGAPQGALVAQVTPTVLTYRASDFASHLGARAGAAIVAGSVVAYRHMDAGTLSMADVALMTIVSAAVTFGFKDPSLRQGGPDTEVKPNQFGSFLNLDDWLFRAGLGIGLAASLEVLIHQGVSGFLSEQFTTDGMALGGAFFVLSLAPKLVHNAYLAVVNRTRDRNRSRVYDLKSGVVQEMRADDARAFSCSGAFVPGRAG